MTDDQKKKLERTHWDIANTLRGKMIRTLSAPNFFDPHRDSFRCAPKP